MNAIRSVLLLIDSGREWRGGQRQAYLLARELSQTGTPVHLVAPAGSPLAVRASELGLGVTELRGKNDLDIAAGLRLAALVKRLKPGIVHCNDSRAHSIAYLARGFGASFSMVVSRRSLRAPRYGAKYRSADRFVAVSRAAAGNLEHSGIPADRVDVVYSGVARPPAGEQPVRPVAPGTDFMIVAVGALEREKGIDTLVAAAACATLKHLSIEWIVVGAGPDLLRLERLRQKLEAPVRFVGWRDAVAGFLHGADLVVHPSRSEALGTAIIEALWRGKPVVASNVGGIPEIIDGTVGSLVPPNDPEALGVAILEWLQDPSRRAAVRESGPRVASRFGVGAMVDGMLRCYARVNQESVS